MRIKTAKNPRWDNEEKTRIRLDVLVDSDREHFVEFIPVVVTEDDIEPHIKQLFWDARNKKFGEVGEYEGEVLSQPEADSRIQELRKENLDVIAVLQFAVDEEVATEDEIEELKKRKKYALELHRIPKQKGYPAKIKWPTLTI